MISAQLLTERYQRAFRDVFVTRYPFVVHAGRAECLDSFVERGLDENKGVRPLNLTLMAMHNPPHPGEFIIQVYLDPNNLSGRELAGKLGVAASTLNRILTGISRLSSNSKCNTTGPNGLRCWLAMQYNHDLWQAKQHVKLGKVGKVRLTAA